MSDEILDVAVVGGGVSGVYSAWRLLTEGGKRQVTVFEGDEHIGGRLLSVTPPHIPYMTAELGGMRILPAVQPQTCIGRTGLRLRRSLFRCPRLGRRRSANR